MTIGAVATANAPLQTGWPTNAPSHTGYGNFHWGPNAAQSGFTVNFDAMTGAQLADLERRGIISVCPPPPGGYPAELRGPATQQHTYAAGGPGPMWGPAGPGGPVGAQAREKQTGGFMNKVNNFTEGLARFTKNVVSIGKAIAPVVMAVV